MDEKKVVRGRGRQKGYTKNITTIKDPLFGPFEIQIEESSYNLLKKNETNGNVECVGYFSTLSSAVYKIVKSNILSKGGVFTLKEYVEDYKKEVEKITKVLGL